MKPVASIDPRHAAVIVLFAITGLGVTLPVHAQSQGDPRLDYMLQCQGCHREDGTGRPDVGVPTIVGLAERFLAKPGGRAYLVQVPGVSQAPLDDHALAQLLNWLLTRYAGHEPPSSFERYTEREVAMHRRNTPIDVVAARARLLSPDVP